MTATIGEVAKKVASGHRYSDDTPIDRPPLSSDPLFWCGTDCDRAGRTARPNDGSGSAAHRRQRRQNIPLLWWTTGSRACG